jgi:hypothetical protein
MEIFMAKSSCFLLSMDAGFDAFFSNQVTRNTSRQSPVLTNIPAEEVTALNAAYNTWHTAYEATLELYMPVVTAAAKNEARAAGKKLLSNFKHRSQLADYVSTTRRRNLTVRKFFQW